VRRLALLISLGVIGTAIPLPCRIARADLAETRAAAEAKVQYDKGTRAYNVGKFDQAIAAFTRAYELDPAPMLLFNIAQSYWKKGENERAVFFYRRYIDADPRTEQRARVEARIRELEASPGSAGRQSAGPPSGTAPSTAGGPSTASPSAARVAAGAPSRAGGPPGVSWATPGPARADEPQAGRLPPVSVADARGETSSAPLYRRPWFWAAIGGLVVGAAAVALAARPGGATGFNCPQTSFGLGCVTVMENPR
jgi:tetratricopeptide (TPR) repeat protein